MNFSLKIKITIAFIVMSLSVVTIYVMLAKNIFESDKVAYVFESRQNIVESIAQNFLKSIQSEVQNGKSMLFGFDPNKKEFHQQALNFFNSKKNILGIQVYDQKRKTSLVELFKDKNIGLKVKEESIPDFTEQLLIKSISNRQFLVFEKESPKSDLIFKIIIETPEPIVSNDKQGSVLLIENGKILDSTNSIKIDDKIIQDISNDPVNTSQIKKNLDADYLVSTYSIPNSEIKVASFFPEKSALAATNRLFRTSLIFFIFTSCLTAIISILLATSITKKLIDLASLAGDIGQGNFSKKPKINSSYEIGVLQRAFIRMIEEIHLLLLATQQKTRMEAELKTAKIVQDQLFPHNKYYTSDHVEVAGAYESSSECCGDWWYYYKKNDSIFVVIADATGHGTPAALITSASRALFSLIEKIDDITTKQIADNWDEVVSQTSGQKVFMTSLILKINVMSGKCSILRASHEPPIYINNKNEASFLTIESSSTLGENKKHWKDHEFLLSKGEKLLLFTDGLWAVENSQGKKLNEKKFLKTVESISMSQNNTKNCLDEIITFIHDHKKDTTYPDDLALVLIQKK